MLPAPLIGADCIAPNASSILLSRNPEDARFFDKFLAARGALHHGLQTLLKLDVDGIVDVLPLQQREELAVAITRPPTTAG